MDRKAIRMVGNLEMICKKSCIASNSFQLFPAATGRFPGSSQSSATTKLWNWSETERQDGDGDGDRVGRLANHVLFALLLRALLLVVVNQWILGIE